MLSVLMLAVKSCQSDQSPVLVPLALQGAMRIHVAPSQ